MADAPNLTPGQGLGTDISGILSLIASLNGTDKSNASQVADIADPFRSQRPQYMDQLSAFMKDPGSIFGDPAFKAAQAQGGETVARNAGAAGMGNSGNKLASLFSYGQSSALDFEKQKFSELLPLSGATQGNPGAAALATQLGQQNQQSGISAGIAGIAGLLTQLGIPSALANQISQAMGGNPTFGANQGSNWSGNADPGGSLGVDGIGGLGGDQSGGIDLGGFGDLAGGSFGSPTDWTNIDFGQFF
jgi:hypothetical protein